ncbi:MAG TPA: ankyrin repeat domain-containing protein [Terriglobales bacterium]|nr:ankyrin repeat domain-containing protein [Terriglobales bacterium]
METSQRGFDACFQLLQAGDADGLRRLLEQDPAWSEARDSTGVSLLMHSLYRGRRDLAELIASQKSALDIFEAASLGRLDRLKQGLRDDASAINSRSKDGFTALHFACFFGQPEAAQLLIEGGAAVDAVAANPTKVMPLHSAASARNLGAARLLLEHGAPVNARQQAGWVPLHAAAQNGDRPMVELLLKHHADPKLANDAGKTSAMVAREKGHEEIAALLET